jgi:hypothetical protein
MKEEFQSDKWWWFRLHIPSKSCYPGR